MKKGVKFMNASFPATTRGAVCRILTGFVLAIAALLTAAPSVDAQSSYQIRPGDTLRVEVFEDDTLNRDVAVLPDGTISFPFVGSIRATGRTLSQVEAAITQGIAPNFSVEPTVFVSLPTVQEEPEAPVTAEPEAPTIDIYFLGEVANPGLQQVSPGTTILQALSIGGFSTFAAQKRVQLRRTNPYTGAQAVYKINYKALASGASLSRDIVLQDGDVILVPERRLFE